MMQMIKIALVLLATVPLVSAGEPKDDKDPPPVRLPEYSDEWLEAVERLRSMPRPGEVKNFGTAASVTELFDLKPEEKAKVVEIAAAYESELLKRAAKWETEQRQLRDEYEVKVIAALPENRRAATKKLLDFSHSKWVSPLDLESGFKREYTRRANELREDRAKLSVEELSEKRKTMQAWVKETRNGINAQSDEVMKGIRELLSPEEAQRLEQFDRNRKQ
jgi:hypothetical protein